ncbi:MAG: RidA family protein [Clostridiaceae bacterium]
MTRTAFNLEGGFSAGPYSHAVGAEETVYLSGQAGVDSSTGKLVEGGIEAQTEQTFKNIFRILETAGLNSDDIQKVNVYLTDMSNFKAMNSVYEKQFKAPYPARTTVGVASLPLGAAVEIEVIATR